MAAFLLCFFGAGSLLLSVNAQQGYDRLPLSYRKGVDLALEKLNSHVGIHHHFLFFKSLMQSEIKPGFDVTYIYHNFYLKATRCPRGTADPSNCPFRNDRPLIDCAICYKTYADAIEAEPKPYVNCVHKPAITEDMKRTRVDHCNAMSYSNGSPTLLAATGTNE